MSLNMVECESVTEIELAIEGSLKSSPGLPFSNAPLATNAWDAETGAYSMELCVMDSELMQRTISTTSEGCLHHVSYLASLFSHRDRPRAVTACCETWKWRMISAACENWVPNRPQDAKSTT
jgi:hypothetical protein